MSHYLCERGECFTVKNTGQAKSLLAVTPNSVIGLLQRSLVGANFINVIAKSGVLSGISTSRSPERDNLLRQPGDSFVPRSEQLIYQSKTSFQKNFSL
jgi:hypothetical protein